MQEYVGPMYLNVEEIKDADSIIYRYFWGARAENEISRWAILKFVAKVSKNKTIYMLT